ncbi:MAG: 4Fe-4S dicluster domain-containing protein [Ruminococcaceae bacterium]|nr:4Fe-4S dicluster domain-containing protein [Oscillospiraceae bacterium]
MLPDIDCVGCGACANICPENCLNMIADKDGFLHPKIDKNICINCQACEKVCSVINNKPKENKAVQPYAVYSKNDNVRSSSSSGGLFYTIAKHIIKHGGIVYGAAFDENLYLNHKGVESIEDLYMLQGSKYVQCDTKFCFREIKTHLDTQRPVLFCGTPCQVEGLLCYLKKPYENLFTLDFICHGVPSPKAWQEYIKHQEKTFSSKVRSASFRDKSKGWSYFSSKLEFVNQKEYSNIHYNDVFMKAFLQNVSLRKTCYNCKFKTVNRNSDITMGDLWGIKNILPDITDDKGVSVVFIQSEKGNRLFEQVNKELWIQEISFDSAIASNSAMTKSVYEHNFRGYFFKNLGKQNFERLVRDCLEPSYYVRLKRKLNNILSK